MKACLKVCANEENANSLKIRLKVDDIVEALRCRRWSAFF